MPSVINLHTILGEDDKDTYLLQAMAVEAERYIKSFGWCKKLHTGRLVDGLGGVFALFLFVADIEKLGEHKKIWVFAGDVPFTYLEADDFPNAKSAAERYIAGIEKWIRAVRNHEPTEELIPISSSKDEETLNTLSTRIETLRAIVLPHLSVARCLEIS